MSSFIKNAFLALLLFSNIYLVKGSDLNIENLANENQLALIKKSLEHLLVIIEKKIDIFNLNIEQKNIVNRLNFILSKIDLALSYNINLTFVQDSLPEKESTEENKEDNLLNENIPSDDPENNIFKELSEEDKKELIDKINLIIDDIKKIIASSFDDFRETEDSKNLLSTLLELNLSLIYTIDVALSKKSLEKEKNIDLSFDNNDSYFEDISLEEEEIIKEENQLNNSSEDFIDNIDIKFHKTEEDIIIL